MEKFVDVLKFENKINYKFKNEELLCLAFTHSSFANETKKGNHRNNERLEFLGDAVLEMVVSDYIYRRYPQMPEGELTKLRAGVVCEGALAKNARKLDFGNYILLGHGEEVTGGKDRDSILADSFEAVIGAIFLDGGIKAVTDYIMSFMKSEVDEMEKEFKTLDCKTCLQEVIQKTSKSPIIYNIIDEQGPDHDKIFVAEVQHNGKILGRGKGKSKKEAEQNAANDALDKLEIS